MPSERRRQKTKEDTWGTEELSKSIKDAMRDDSAQKKRSHDKEKRRDGERTKDREHRKDKEHRDRDKDKEKRRREKHRSEDVDNKDGHRDKTRDRDKEDRHKEDKDRRHRNEDEREKKRGESSRDKDRTRDDKERRHKEKSQDKERKHRENGERNSAQDKERRHRDDKERRHRDDKDKDRDRERRHRDDKEKRHRDDKDKDRERRHRDDKERSHDKEGDREKRHKEDKERRSDKDKERRHRDDKERHKNKDKRDSEDREKHRDRNKREEENGEEERQNHRTRRDSKYDEDTGESVRHRSEDQRSEEKEEDVEDEIQQGNEENGDDEYGYEDDFEDYDDDFEDDDEDEESEDKDEEDSVATRQTSAELDAIRRAMASENQAMHSGRKSKDTNSSGNSSRATTAKSSRSFINFVAAKQRQINSQVTEHSRKRGKDLMSLIELDVVGFDMFDMAPVREYELYIKSFGRSNTKQAFVQYNEDNLDRDVQTDPIENREIWTQHPAEGVSAFGGAGEKSDEDEVVNEADSLRLSKFLQKAGQAINILLEEDASDNAKGTLQSNQRSIIFSDGYSQLNSQLSFLKERHVVHAQFHPIQTNLLLTVHSTPKKVDGVNSLSNRGLLCVWNVNEPFRPQKILSCKSTPTCCVFSPTKSTLAFAGTVDGSIVVWDLREPSSMHMSQEYDGQEWSIRVPTFSTDGIQDTHHSSVVTMQPIVAAEESLKASMQSTHTNGITDGLSFQLASLEEQGFIHFSVVIEIDKPDLAGSESDLGLVPSGKIKLIKTSSVSLTTSPSRGLGDAMKAFHMQLSPLDPNQFFVATDSGHIIHGARHGGKVPPRLYRDQLDLPVDIVQIDFSPFGLPVFLVACGDGSIRLHNITTDLPVITWNNSTNGISIKSIQWSRSRPSVFFVMDEASKVYVWELLENDGAPVKTEQFTHASLTFLTLSSDHPGSGRGQPNRRQEMLITDAKGAMDVHRINKTFSRSRENELNDMAQLLNNIT